MKVLVTGGNGFLGSALVHGLLRQGQEVSVLTRASSIVTRLRTAVDQISIGRCENDAEIGRFVRQIDPEVIVHTACSYGRAGESPLRIVDANMRYGLVVLDAALTGESRKVTFLNTGTVLAPHVNLYALSKHQFTQWGSAIAAGQQSKLRFVNIQLQHMYGPGDDDLKFPTQVIRACMANRPELALTAGEQLRDFVFIDDVVDAYLTLIAQHKQLETLEDIEVGSGDAPSIRKFVETARELTNSITQLNFGAKPYRVNEAMLCRADLARMRSLGWTPAFDLVAGIKKTIEMERLI